MADRQLNAMEESVKMADIPMEKVRDIVELLLEREGLTIIKVDQGYDYYPEHRYRFELTDEKVIPYND